MIIGVVGQQGSGKDTAAEYLVEYYGFLHISSGDQIRKYIKEHNLGETTRDVIQATVTELRAKYGPGVLVEQILHDHPNSKLVISGLRHPDEARLITGKGGIIVGLNAAQSERYNRSLDRKRVGDQIDFKTFAAQEAKENGADTATWNIQALVDSATEHVQNTGSFEDFYSQLDKIMARYKLKRLG